MLRLASIAVAALILGAPAYAQDRTAEIDTIFSFAMPGTPGCAVGVSHGGEVVVNRAYGLADVESRVPMSPNSIFDIGSTQKQFVAAAVLLLAEDGRLSLSDEVRKHIPELSDYGHKITLGHLLNHTSGLRDWIWLSNLSSKDEDALTRILRQNALNFTPGEEFSYSNSGYVLLKEIVARTSGMSFADFASKRLFEPLGMKSSAYVADVLEGSGPVALAYQKEDNGWKQFMRLGNNRGGGAIVSTTGDLLIWNDVLERGGLGAFVTGKLQEQAKLNNGRKLSYARGLIVDAHRGGPLVWHSGGAAGYSTWLGRLPDRDLSVAVMCNFEPVSSTALAHRVIDLFLPPAGAQAAPAEAPTTSSGAAGAEEIDVNGRAGLFFNESTGEAMRLIADEGTLRIATGPQLVGVTQDRFRNAQGDLFFRSQDEFELHFHSQEQFELKSMEGETSRYRRAQPYAHTPAELKAFEGRYENQDLGVVVEFVPWEKGLVMRFESASGEKKYGFTPAERDTYMASLMLVRFRRDGSGKVVGFDYSNPVLRNLRFERSSGRAR